MTDNMLERDERGATYTYTAYETEEPIDYLEVRILAATAIFIIPICDGHRFMYIGHNYYITITVTYSKAVPVKPHTAPVAGQSTVPCVSMIRMMIMVSPSGEYQRTKWSRSSTFTMRKEQK